ELPVSPRDRETSHTLWISRLFPSPSLPPLIAEEMLRTQLLLLALSLALVSAIPVDNNVEGEPEIECGPTSITVNFNTRNPFMGHVFVKGLYDQQNCRNDEGGRQVAGIELAFDTCNVARTRSLNPKGIFVSTTVIISFHPQFVTKVDGAYRIECFYMESDKTVSADIEVSDLTTQFQTALVPMPVCKYEILDNGPTGEPVKFASVGQHVYHKWTCESETTDTFCSVVHSCTVDDGNGDRIMILNEDGCALDKFILNNLEYPQDLVAGQEAHVYKYADRNQLFYQCQISISVKEPNQECARPQCPEARNFGAKKVAEDAAVAHTTGESYNPTTQQVAVTASNYPATAAPAVAASTPAPAAPATSQRQRISIFSRKSSTTPEAVVSPEPHQGSSELFTAQALVEDDEESRIDHVLRLLRRKREIPEKDGVRVFSLDDSIESLVKSTNPVGDSNHSIRKRIKREDSPVWDGHTVDVRAELTALDYTDAEAALADLLRARRASRSTAEQLVSLSPINHNVCISMSALSFLGALTLILFSSLLFVITVLFRPRGSKSIDESEC
ncbi:hypothetical protein PMAYCL1PPCAC_04480, partial [Pristionchus mayeri]